MFFLAFFLLMEEEKSSKKRKPLYKKILNKELSSEQFETLFKKFRNSLETKSIRFHETYQWFEVDDSVVFTGTPEQQKERAAFGISIQPKFVLRENNLIAKLDIGQLQICLCYGNYFGAEQCCWPVYRWDFPIKKISESKRYVPKFKKAIISALQSFE